MHYHRSFREVFTVESGTLHLELPEGAVLLEPGQEHRVARLYGISNSTLPRYCPSAFAGRAAGPESAGGLHFEPMPAMACRNEMTQ